MIVGRRASVSSRERISDEPNPYLPARRVVDLQSQAVERRFPPVVVGDDERQVADQVRSVLPKQSALLERLHDERDVALLEVADAAVDELRAAARRAFAEVVLFEQQDVVAAARRVDGDADAGGAAADDDDVPGLVSLRRAARSCRTRCIATAPVAIQPFERFSASRHSRAARRRLRRGIAGSKRRSTCQCRASASVESQKPTARPAR